MKKFLFSILSAFMVSTMASAQYLNVKSDDGTYSSFKTSAKTEVSFGAKKGAELTPSGYYSKEEVDSLLKEIKDILIGERRNVELAKQVVGSVGAVIMLDEVQQQIIMLLENIKSFESKIREMELKLQEVQGSINGLSGKIESMECDIDALRKRIYELEDKR